MDIEAPGVGPVRFLSLRWKALIGLSLVLVLVNASLAYLAYRQSAFQFELHRSEVHQKQSDQLRGMLRGQADEMSRLATLVPLMGPDPPLDDLGFQLELALSTNGAMLTLEWDIQSVQWIDPQGVRDLFWPEQEDRLFPPALEWRIAAAPEERATIVSCRPECRQYLATPLLWDGSFAGTLILSRSLADSLLAFHELTGAEVAIVPSQFRDAPPDPAGTGGGGQGAQGYLAITHPERTKPILAGVGGELAPHAGANESILVQQGAAWYDLFRLNALAPGIDAYLINNVTKQRETIQEAIGYSAAIGLIGLILSEGLLLYMLKVPLTRLRRIAGALPLLAENRYRELREYLPQSRTRLRANDEMDLMVESVGSLIDRMEMLQHDRELAEGRLNWLADHDPLTQIFNRRRFLAELVQALDQATRRGRQGVILFFDLDLFKDVNDTSGHQVGDALLQQVAEQLQSLAGPNDILARLGGDEFAWIRAESTHRQAVEIAESIQRTIGSTVTDTPNRRHRVSASIGIVLFPDQGRETDQLMANADLAMYQAKEKGRGRWHFFAETDQAQEQADARVWWSRRIAEALPQDRFELYFQPIVDVATGRIWHHEALLRMRSDRGEMILPDQFIPVAEKTGQIQAIDHWVVENAIGIMNQRSDLNLSVNLSANALEDPLLLSTLERLLERLAVAPARLSFEITETAAISSVERAIEFMRGIQRLGCRIAIDDFGSGYASYAYLKRLPVDDIKIDGAFVRNLLQNREDRIFVKAITDISHGMGKRVIAEFVENAGILRVLEGLGVDFAQGYHLGKPVPLSEC